MGEIVELVLGHEGPAPVLIPAYRLGKEELMIRVSVIAHWRWMSQDGILHLNF